MAQVLKVRKKPIEIQVIKWENNEPEIRKFIDDDDLVKFGENNLQVWNTEEQDWLRVPMFHYIARGVKNELYAISPEILERTYDLISE